MSARFLLGIDQGTTGTKAVLFDDQLRVVDEAYQPIRVEHPQSGWVQQDPEELAIGRIESAMLWDCINALSPEHRQVLLLRVVAGLRAREVGDIMDRTEEAVRSLQLRALSALRSLWKEASPVDPVPGAAD